MFIKSCKYFLNQKYFCLSCHLNGGECLVVLAAGDPGDAAGAPSLALVPEPEPLAGRLLQDLHVGGLLGPRLQRHPAAARPRHLLLLLAGAPLDRGQNIG